MRPEIVLKHEFVEFVPAELEEGTLYVSMKYGTVVHKCCCGCGTKVVTPLRPTDWKLTYDGRSISLEPSIGRWSSPCKAHYWITESRVRWSTRWSQEMIEAGRAHEMQVKERYFGGTAERLPATPPTPIPQTPAVTELSEAKKPEEGFWQKVKRKFFG
jgi:hypothetical protein